MKNVKTFLGNVIFEVTSNTKMFIGILVITVLVIGMALCAIFHPMTATVYAAAEDGASVLEKDDDGIHITVNDNGTEVRVNAENWDALSIGDTVKGVEINDAVKTIAVWWLIFMMPLTIAGFWTAYASENP